MNSSTSVWAVSLAAGVLCFSLSTHDASAESAAVHWAGSVADSNFVGADLALGAPDEVFAAFLDGNAATLETAEFVDFGAADDSYDVTALGNLLGISGALLATADIIGFEANGSVGVTFESSDWLFTDGLDALQVSHTFSDGPTGAVIALGNISNQDYADFFGFDNTRPSGDWAYILFDIDGHSAVDTASPAFAVTLSAAGSTATDSPDVDAIGRMSVVPVPAGLVLLSSALLGLCSRRFFYELTGARARAGRFRAISGPRRRFHGRCPRSERRRECIGGCSRSSVPLAVVYQTLAGYQNHHAGRARSGNRHGHNH